MPLCFGAHVSCQGGLLKGVERAVAAGCDCMQVFTASPQQWPCATSLIPVTPRPKDAKTDAQRSPVATGPWQCADLTDEVVERFRAALTKSGLPAPVAHTSYLINLASPSPELWEKSIDALEIEWSRAERLQLAGLVMHPGAHLTQSPEAGLERIVEGVERVIERVQPKCCRLLLENTAGQGSCLGWQFEQLGWLVERLNRPAQIGICFDTCHAFAAGYDFSTAAKLKAMWQAFDTHIGLEHLCAVHVNDSKKGLGSRVDRHEQIGCGAIGETAFGLFLRSAPVEKLPMFLETPKGTDEVTGVDLDVQNLATLRRLAQTTRRRPLSSKVN